MDGRTLHFHLAGINNQNFIMRDEETGTWWQQVTGCGILGPLAGRCLGAIDWDEVSFGVWKAEHPQTVVLRPEPAMKEDYASADWEKEIAGYPTVAPGDPADPLQPRDLLVGVSVGAAATAYPFTALAATSLIADQVGGTPVLILLHPDGRSLRCYERRLDGEPLEMFLEVGHGEPGTAAPGAGEPSAGKTDAVEPGSGKPPAVEPALLDGRTGSHWNFAGRATDGPLAGRQLAHLACLKDFWFDWKNYHPATAVFAAAKGADAKAADANATGAKAVVRQP